MTLIPDPVSAPRRRLTQQEREQRDLDRAQERADRAMDRQRAAALRKADRESEKLERAHVRQEARAAALRSKQPPQFSDSMTLGEARTLLRQAVAKQLVTCPCCGGPAKVYERALYHAHVRALIRLFWLDRREPGSDHPVNTFVNITKHFSIMKFWGLVTDLATHEVVDDKAKTGDTVADTGAKRSSGRWRITAMGRDFVLGTISVPASITFYQGAVLAYSEEKVTINQVLTTTFNYRDLMAASAEKVMLPPMPGM